MTVPVSNAEIFWQTLPTLAYRSEAGVEQRFVLPMLRALGYSDSEITAKASVVFQEGRQGRPHEADFIVHTGTVPDQNNALIVIEAKKPEVDLAEGRRQAESYAHASRAPFLLLTDGETFELWQMQISRSSERVFAGDVRALASDRGLIESLIGRGAAKAHSISLGYRVVLDAALDISPYVNAELKRLGNKPILSRRLGNGAGNGVNDAKAVLDGEYRNLLITGGSGDGKTTLAEELYRHSLSSLADDGPIPFLLSLAELAEISETTTVYAQHRLAAHCPQFGTSSSFQTLLKTRGAILICDGLDRINDRSQRKFLASCASLIRDYSRLNLIVLGRAMIENDIGLQHFEIQPLSNDEKWTLAGLIGVDSMIVHRIPQALDQMTESPLLLTLILRHMQQTGHPPDQLADIFQSWLDRLFAASSISAASRSRLHQLLSNIAARMQGSSSSREEILASFGHLPDLERQIDDLVRCGAITWKRQVEICHDALGDFLRAEKFLGQDEAQICDQLQNKIIEAGSLFPILLLSMCKTWTVRQAIWARLGKTSLPTYLDALRFDQRFDKLQSSPDNAYFQDFRDGIVHPLKWFFPNISGAVNSALAWSDAPQLGIKGVLSTDGEHFSYEFFPASETGEPIASTHWNQQSGGGGFATNYFGPSGSSRKMGFNKLVNGLESVLKARNLQGGPYWSNERLIGRIRWMNSQFCEATPTNIALDELKHFLQPDLSSFVHFGHFNDRGFQIASMVTDIEKLLSDNWTHLDPWWEKYGVDHNDSSPDQEQESGLIGEFWRRSQLVYQEIVEKNFAIIAPYLNFFCGMPMRYELTMYPGRLSGRSMWYVYRPIEKWSDAGADVSFDIENHSTLDDQHYQKVMATLAQLGRVGCTSVSSGQKPAPIFDGDRHLNGFDGETAALRQAMEMLVSDLNRIFDRGPVEQLKERDII